MKADGGAAFPVLRTGPKYTERGTPYGEQIYSVGGMTLRDWFAGQAFGSVMCEPDIESYTQAARRAYEAADAMLAERERGECNA